MIKRTDSQNPDFQRLAAELEAALRILDGDAQDELAALNAVDQLPQALVYFENGDALACGALRAYTKESAEIKRMYVRPAARRKGIAAAMLQALEAWAQELGYQSCVLETGRNQPEAIACYQRHGYTVVPNFGRYVGNPHSLCFLKTLPPVL